MNHVNKRIGSGRVANCWIVLFAYTSINQMAHSSLKCSEFYKQTNLDTMSTSSTTQNAIGGHEDNAKFIFGNEVMEACLEELHAGVHEKIRDDPCLKMKNVHARMPRSGA
jgi:hypothetical protein